MYPDLYVLPAENGISRMLYQELEQLINENKQLKRKDRKTSTKIVHDHKSSVMGEALNQILPRYCFTISSIYTIDILIHLAISLVISRIERFKS
jgi:P2-related tail formation protein